MKTIISILCFLQLASFTFAGEITGAGQVAQILKRHNLSLSTLQAQGLTLGDITGAGKSINLDRINMLVTGQNVFPMGEATHIDFKNPSAAKTLIDVTHLEFNGKKVRTNQIKGILYR